MDTLQVERTRKHGMKVVHGLEGLGSGLARSVLTIGNFDGVHRAHARLVARARQLAAGSDTPVVVLTFDPHPSSIVAPSKTPPRLMPIDHRVKYLEQAGANMVVIARSNTSLLGMEAEVFIADIITGLFHPTHIVEGPSFGFGRGRKGNAELLHTVAGRFGFQVDIVDPMMIELENDNLMISSSLIRSLLISGKVSQAAACLGRSYTLVGRVVEGERRGRTIGFPTVNLAVEDQLIPGDGVYAGRAHVDDDIHSAAISVGNKATFGEREQAVEAHLLDFDGDLYGHSIGLEFNRRLRDQQAFDSTDALTAQLRRDVVETRRTHDAHQATTP